MSAERKLTSLYKEFVDLEIKWEETKDENLLVKMNDINITIKNLEFHILRKDIGK